MMNWGDGDWGWGSWLVMAVIMIVFWGLVAWVIVTLVRGSAGAQHQDRSAEDILAERFARGEINEDEYRQRRDTLRSKP